MKKEYVKLSISFNSLPLKTNMSSGCSYQSSHDLGVCPVDIGGGETIYVQDSCTWWNAEEICYDIPTATSNVFES
ncbi:MAG: hypothetical protein KBT46_05705 [Ruminococcus sp.]|nr:hypothetical protein [Candidatus Copronaster equi]